jgi:hypothetical protein
LPALQGGQGQAIYWSLVSPAETCRRPKGIDPCGLQGEEKNQMPFMWIDKRTLSLIDEFRGWLNDLDDLPNSSRKEVFEILVFCGHDNISSMSEHGVRQRKKIACAIKLAKAKRNMRKLRDISRRLGRYEILPEAEAKWQAAQQIAETHYKAVNDALELLKSAVPPVLH